MRGIVHGGDGVHVSFPFFPPSAILHVPNLQCRAPTTGGQYHWVSEFAPPSSQRFLSYLVGWLCVLGWQVGNVAVAFLTAQQIQGLIILNNLETYTPQRWHLTLLVIAIETVCQLLNTVWYRALPLLETLALILHLGGFFAVLGPLWASEGFRTRATSSLGEVFFTFTDGGGWGNTALSCLVGMVSPLFGLIGPDSAGHMAEELRNASKSLPRAMISTMLANGALGLVSIVTFCMTMGGDVEDVEDILATPTTQPFIQVFFNATGSKVGTTLMTCVMVVMAACGVVNNIATSSRQLWAFARDKGVPFSSWFANVHPGMGLPVNALVFSYGLAVALSLINIGSTIVSFFPPFFFLFLGSDAGEGVLT